MNIFHYHLHRMSEPDPTSTAWPQDRTRPAIQSARGIRFGAVLPFHYPSKHAYYEVKMRKAVPIK